MLKLKKAEAEEPVGRAIADHVLTNDDLEKTVDDMLVVIIKERSRR